MTSSVQEKLISLIQKEAEKSLKYWNKCSDISEAAEICDDFVEIIELCNKISTTDYFKKSESVIDTFVTTTDIENSVSQSKYSKMCDNWLVAYKLDRRAKKKDLIKLFKLVVERIEDFD